MKGRKLNNKNELPVKAGLVPGFVDNLAGYVDGQCAVHFESEAD